MWEAGKGLAHRKFRSNSKVSLEVLPPGKALHSPATAGNTWELNKSDAKKESPISSYIQWDKL